MVKDLKNKVVTCIKNTHQIYDDSFKRSNIIVGKPYLCTNELYLTTSNYYIPEFSSLRGITIKTHVTKWGWEKSCFPKECFRVSNKDEIKKYKVSIAIYTPFRFIKIYFYKIFRSIDKIVRWKYYKKLNDEFEY